MEILKNTKERPIRKASPLILTRMVGQMTQLLSGTGINEDSPWRVLHVIANHEKRVAQHLDTRSVEYYLPLYKEKSHRRDRAVTLDRPLFAGYVFARIAPQARITVLSIPSVLRLLGDGQQITVSAAEIEQIREGLAGGCVLRPHSGIAVGTRVRIRKGCFAGAEGIVTKFCKPCKVVMILAATEQRFSAEVDIEDLEILGKVA